MPKTNDEARLLREFWASQNDQRASERATYFGDVNHPHTAYRALRRDDTFFTERDRAMAPLKGADSIHNRLECSPAKMCHYGMALDDGWCARVRWERDNGVDPDAHARGFQAAIAVVKALVDDARWRLGDSDWPRRKWGLDRLAHYVEILEALEAER